MGTTTRCSSVQGSDSAGWVTGEDRTPKGTRTKCDHQATLNTRPNRAQITIDILSQATLIQNKSQQTDVSSSSEEPKFPSLIGRRQLQRIDKNGTATRNGSWGEKCYPEVVHLPDLVNAVVHRLQTTDNRLGIKERTLGGEGMADLGSGGRGRGGGREGAPARPRRRRRRRRLRRRRCGASPRGRARRGGPWRTAAAAAGGRAVDGGERARGERIRRRLLFIFFPSWLTWLNNNDPFLLGRTQWPIEFFFSIFITKIHVYLLVSQKNVFT